MLNALENHVKTIIKSGSAIFTGDESHPTVKEILNIMNGDDKVSYRYTDLKRDVELLPIFCNNSTHDDIENAIQGKSWLQGELHLRCRECGKQINYSVSGNTIKFHANSSCENNSIYEVEMDFPTGEIVFDDWPDRFSELQDNEILVTEYSSVNYNRGKKECTLAYSKYNILHHFVGNTCPSLFISDDLGSIIVPTIELPDDYDEFEDDDYVQHIGYNNVGSFCTDLWWITIMDKKFYDDMINKLPLTRDDAFYKKTLNIARIKPGRYRFTCYLNAKNYMTAIRIGDIT